MRQRHRIPAAFFAALVAVVANVWLLAAGVASAQTVTPVNGTSGLGVDPMGAVYIAESGNARIRRVSPEGANDRRTGQYGSDGGP